jgi:hypothetical protein
MKLNKNYIIEGKRIKAGAKLHLMNECIIVAGRCKDDHVFLTKNRDRSYFPRGSIVHDFVNLKVERIMFFDIETAWGEGLIYNHETGVTIGLENTALSISDDENMKKIVSKNKTRSPDGINIDYLLSLGDYDKITEAILNKDHAITGHTFLVEISKEGKIRSHKFEVITLVSKDTKDLPEDEQELELVIAEGDINIEELAVRTNHAYLLKNTVDKEGNPVDVGYTISDDYLSSLQRKITAETKLADESIRKTYDIKKIMDVLKQKDYEFDSPLNTNRDLYKANEEGANIGLRTTGQIGLDLTAKTFYYDNVFKKSEIIMVLNKMPKDVKPKLKVLLLGQNETTEVVDY